MTGVAHDAPPPRSRASVPVDAAGPSSRRDTAGARERAWFPGWRWTAVALAFPLAGLLGWAIGGAVDDVRAALVGGAITGAGLGAVQWWGADGAFGSAAAWTTSSAAGYAGGLAAGAALVGYDTDLGALAVMGLVSGAVLGAAQGLVLARAGAPRLAVVWGLAMPALLALGWCATSAAGIGVEDRFTVFGAAGAIVFTLLSGVLLARAGPARAPAPGATSRPLAAGR